MAGYLVLFTQPMGRVNMMYETDDYRLVPFDCECLKDWDKIFGGYKLAVTPEGYLNVDVGNEENPDIITSFVGMETRTLKDCIEHCLNNYWMENDTHHPKLHPSWYSYIEKK